MRTIDHRKEQQLTFSASAALLKEGARFNDKIDRLPTGRSTFISKGAFLFKSHEAANLHQQTRLIARAARISDGHPVHKMSLEGPLRPKQTMRGKDAEDPIMLEHALETLGGSGGKA